MSALVGEFSGFYVFQTLYEISGWKKQEVAVVWGGSGWPHLALMHSVLFSQTRCFGTQSMTARFPAIYIGLLLCLAPRLLPADETSTPQQPLRSNPPAVFAITGAMVVTGPNDAPQPAVIIVRNGIIDAVGPGLPIPADAREIALPGRTIYPGFIDAYSEVELSSDRLTGTARYWNGQVTPQLSVADQPSVADTVALRRQGIVARLAAPADGVIRGKSALLSTADGDASTKILARDIAQHLTLTVPRRFRSGYPGSPMGAVALARQAMLDAQWFRDAKIAILADPKLPPVEQNDALAALQPVIAADMPIFVSTSDEQFVLRADRFAAEFGLSLVIVGNGREYRRLSEIAASDDPSFCHSTFPNPLPSVLPKTPAMSPSNLCCTGILPPKIQPAFMLQGSVSPSPHTSSRAPENSSKPSAGQSLADCRPLRL